MLTITVEPIERFDYEHERFVTPSFKHPVTLTLEHSLISLSKWESKWKEPFLVEGKQTHSAEQMLDYVKCMTVNQVPDDVYDYLSVDNFNDIFDYIQDSMTATTFSNTDKVAVRRNKETITAELIYYWMVTFRIDKEYEKWHLNRLLTLINVCSVKNQPSKKMSRQQALMQQRALNSARRKKYGTRG